MKHIRVEKIITDAWFVIIVINNWSLLINEAQEPNNYPYK